MEQSRDEQAKRELPPSIVTMITTEHYTLQSARSQSFAEIIARVSIMMTTISTVLIALALIGQISQLRTAFFVFGMILFPSLVFFGLVNFVGILQAQNQEMIYMLGINRLRHLYLEQAPQLQPYFILPAHDDMTGYWSSRDEPFSWWEIFVAPASAIAVMTSILMGVFVGLMLYAFWTLPLLPCVSGGGLTFLVSVALLMDYQRRRWNHLQRKHVALFPSTAPHSI
jgi:hypothetical protein